MSSDRTLPNPQPEHVRAWARLIRTSQLLLQRIEQDLKDADLPPLTWYDALHEIARGGEAGIRPYELGGRMLLAQYGTSRLLARLELNGLIRRETCVDDGRGQVIRITEAGLEMRRRIWAVYGKGIEQHIGARLTREQAETLAEMLSYLAADNDGAG